MSALLQGTTVATNAEKETDRLGGFQLYDSGIYPMAIEVAYLQIAASGARSITFHFKGEVGSFRSTQFFTSGTEKGCKTYYEKDGKQFNLPGYTMVNDICLLAGIGGIAGAELEEKVLKLWSKDAQGEVPTKVQVITNLLGKQIACGLLKQTVDKTALGGDNEYHPTGETRDENELDKVFHVETGLTAVEMEASANSATPLEPDFLHKWKAKYEGQTLNKAKGATAGGTAGNAAAAHTPKKLFK